VLQVSVRSTETNRSTNSIQFPVYRFVVKKHYLAEVANEVPFDYSLSCLHFGQKYQKSVHVCQSYIASQRLERLGDIVQNDTNYCLLYFRYAKKAVEVVWWSDR